MEAQISIGQDKVVVRYFNLFIRKQVIYGNNLDIVYVDGKVLVGANIRNSKRDWVFVAPESEVSITLIKKL